jgi:hypothetical protein
MEGIRVSGRGICLGGKRFWQLAVFAATGTLGATSQTEAAIYYWQDSAPAVTESAPKAPARNAKTRRLGEKKSAVVEKESKPQGPLIISISIAQQKLRVYDANGLFAESPVSTGMSGHPTGLASPCTPVCFRDIRLLTAASACRRLSPSRCMAGPE